MIPCAHGAGAASGAGGDTARTTTGPALHIPERYVERYGQETEPRRHVCPGCGQPFVPCGRQLYHDAACKQRAYRARRARPVQAAGQAPVGTVTERSMYTCPDCGEQYFGERWCDSCQRPCRRVGFAFECECGEVHLLEDILAGFGIHLDEAALPVRPRSAMSNRKHPSDSHRRPSVQSAAHSGDRL